MKLVLAIIAAACAIGLLISLKTSEEYDVTQDEKWNYPEKYLKKTNTGFFDGLKQLWEAADKRDVAERLQKSEQAKKLWEETHQQRLSD